MLLENKGYVYAEECAETYQSVAALTKHQILATAPESSHFLANLATSDSCNFFAPISRLQQLETILWLVIK